MEQNRYSDQSNNEQTISDLKELRSIASEQNKSQFVRAIDVALKALGDDQEQEDKQDGLKLSGSPADQLIQLSQQVRNTTLTPSQRTAAAHRLVRLSGGR